MAGSQSCISRAALTYLLGAKVGKKFCPINIKDLCSDPGDTKAAAFVVPPNIKMSNISTTNCKGFKEMVQY